MCNWSSANRENFSPPDDTGRVDATATIELVRQRAQKIDDETVPVVITKTLIAKTLIEVPRLGDFASGSLFAIVKYRRWRIKFRTLVFAHRRSN